MLLGKHKCRILRKCIVQLLICVTIGLIVACVIGGKSNRMLRSIAISSDEQHIACFGNVNGSQISCFDANGVVMFHYDIPLEISSGGYCSLWFDDQVLCAQFYKTDKIVSFDMTGNVVGISNATADEIPPKYPSFVHRANQYIFTGEKIEVVYNTGGLLGYWVFGAERFLAVTPRGERTITIMSWIAQNS